MTIPNTATDHVQLASRLRLAVTRTARRLRQEAGSELSPSQMAALATIERRGPLTPSELADLERIKRPTATRVAARLAEAGLIQRSGDPTDGRVSLLSVTPDGRALLRRLRGRKTAFLAHRFRDLPPEDLVALERAAGLLESILDEPASR